MAMRLSSTEGRMKAKSVNSSSAEDITKLAKNLLDNPAVCRSSLNGKSASNDSFDFIENKSGVKIFEKNKIYDGVMILDFRTRGGGNDGTYFLSNDHGFTNVQIIFQRPGSKPNEGIIVKRFPLWVKLSGPNTIIDCGSVNLAHNSYWLRSFSVPQNISYQAGLVGMNTSSPALALDVRGQIRATNLANEELILGTDPVDRYRLSLEADRKFRVTQGGSGGTFQVRGLLPTDEIRPAGDVSCNTGSEGSMRYNSSTRRVELCVQTLTSAYTWIYFLE